MQVAVKFALIALFKELDLDRLMVLCGAANGSANNIVARLVSIINLKLAHLSLCCFNMLEWDESCVRHCNSLVSLQNKVKDVRKNHDKALAQFPGFMEKHKAAITGQSLGSFLAQNFDCSAAVITRTFDCIDKLAPEINIKGGVFANITGAVVTQDGTMLSYYKRSNEKLIS
eukprot:13304305-Ditylum_brightwellii.AAC.1